MSELLKTYDGMGIFAARTDSDKEGNDLTLGIEGDILVLTDENDEPLFDPKGSRMLDPESTAVVNTIGGVGLHAESSDTDGAGNNIVDTYATKADISAVTPLVAYISSSNQTWSIDKTFTELKAAYDADKPVIVLFSGGSADNTFLGRIDRVFKKTGDHWQMDFQQVSYPDGLAGSHTSIIMKASLDDTDSLTVNVFEHVVFSSDCPNDGKVYGRSRTGTSELNATWLDVKSIISVSKTAAASVTVDNNAMNLITGTTPAAMTLVATSDTTKGEIVNFAAQITATANCTLTITANGNSTLYSKSAGNSLESGKTYQISCLNNCWTMAEFETPA
jgi:hypothetical protein